MKGRTAQILIHITGGIIFLALPVLFAPYPSSSFEALRNPPSQRDMIAYALLLAFFYLNYFLLIPRLYFTEKYLVYFVIVLGCVSLVIVLPELITHRHFGGHLPPKFSGDHPSEGGLPPKRRGPWFFFQTGQYVLIFLVLFFFSLLLKIRERWSRAEKERLNNELSLLKAQINPHFLFNTLNSIYSLAIRKDDRTADAIVQLSELMRYSIREANDDWVPLEKEISYIRNYISLQRSRLENTVQIHYEEKVDAQNKKIAPLILISFIENAFKHGVNPDKPSAIEIRISIEGNDLSLFVSNKKVNLNPDTEGIGVQNSKTRLQLLYAGKHKLSIKDEADNYIVDLLMTLE